MRIERLEWSHADNCTYAWRGDGARLRIKMRWPTSFIDKTQPDGLRYDPIGTLNEWLGFRGD